MLNNEELLEHPNYLLSTYQNEIYRQLNQYMKDNNLKKQDVAEKLSVSRSYVSQILNGDFNFTLKKLIELGLMMNKVPYLEFVSPKEYWAREEEGMPTQVVKEHHYILEVKATESSFSEMYPFLDQFGGSQVKTVKLKTNTKEVVH